MIYLILIIRNYYLLTTHPWKFYRKTHFEASQAVLRSLLCYIVKSSNLPWSNLMVVNFAAFWSRCKVLACERKGRWVVEQDFHGKFQVNVTFFFFAFFFRVLDWIVLILVRFEKSIHSAQVSGHSCPWPLKLMMSQAVEGMLICMDSYGWIRGEWVK